MPTPTPSPEAIYQQIGELVRTPPVLVPRQSLTPEQLLWLGRATALVAATGEITDVTLIRHHSEHLSPRYSDNNRFAAREQIMNALYRALAWAELRAPVGMQGAYIPAGNVFDALAAVGRVLQSATADVLIVDPYMDANALTDFAVLALESVQVRLLTDEAGVKPGLRPAAQQWAAQHSSRRPLEVRKTPPRALHDRLIIVDNTSAYVLGQSLNALATRAPTAVVRTDPDTASMKVAAYATIWAAATPL